MNRQGGQIISCPPAPSAPPTSVSTSAVTSSSITVQWGAVDCIHHNGDITGYSVRYGVQGSAEGDRTVVMASGGSSGGLYVIFGLSPSTTYTIEVAAVTSAGTGVYSDPLPVDTPPGAHEYSVQHIVMLSVWGHPAVVTQHVRLFRV